MESELEKKVKNSLLSLVEYCRERCDMDDRADCEECHRITAEQFHILALFEEYKKK